MPVPDKRPAKRIVEGSTLERIQYFYEFGEDKITLTDVEEKQRERWELAFHIQRKHRSPERTANILSRLCNISLATSRRDVSACNKIFPNLIETNKAMDRLLLTETAWETLRRAKKQNNLKEENAATKNLILLKALDKDDALIPDFGNIGTQNNIIIIANPAEVGIKPIENLDALIRQYEKKKKVIDITPNGE